MRGEFIGVWSETWREIWLPLLDRENIPNDIFSELYRTLAVALKDPSGDDAIALVVNDAILLREAFERALVITGVEIELDHVDAAFDGSGAMDYDNPLRRKSALKTMLARLIGDPTKAGEAFGQALVELADSPQRCAAAKERVLEDIVNDTVKSREVFERVQSGSILGERAVVAFLETTFDIVDDLGGDELSNAYFNLLAGFIDKFSLRNDLRRPCLLCPTLPGVFASLVRNLREITSQDAHLDGLMKDFEDTVRDLRIGCSDGRIRTCISKQFMLLEALGAIAPGVTKGTLGGICDELASWPHTAVKESLKKLYGFASDYPGIRHGKNAGGKLRDIDMRDMVAMSIMLAGFTPYLSDRLDADVVYRGA